ncbi:MAG: permease [Candidatus Thermoplasmatota archaeon]|nr:permease [Candidatus Thermoplasmatota archaeon]
MNMTALIINSIALIALIIAFIKNKEKTILSLKIAGKTFIMMLPMIFIIIIIIGLLLGFVPPDQISRFIGEQSGPGGVLLVGILGALMHIPALLSFPLAASMLSSGASVTSVVAFITTLTMIGMITLPLEIQILGKKMAFLRNGLSFIIALSIAFIMGLIL